MSAPSDATLLRDWTIAGSEDAFAILARRYGGLLYHAAMRRTGREDLAGEAAQNSLLILARKAPGLTDLPSLAGWLHRTACYEAAKLQRRELRHEARMKHLPPPEDPADGESRWQDAAPLLDEALDALPEKDRQVIFLKYFDGLSFEQMARQFGGEPAAWRQRGSRAVERLRMSLTKRGVAVSSGTLATGLGTTLSQAAPASLIATLAASPAAGAAALSWSSLTSHSLHFMKLHPATLVLATLLLSAIPLTLQAMANSSARERVTLLESTLTTPSGQSTAAARRNTTPVAARAAKADLLSLADQIAAGNSGSRLAKLEAELRIKGMSEEELEELLTEALSVDLHPEKRLEVISGLFFQYAYFRSPRVSVEKVMRMAAMLSDQMGKKGQEMVWGLAGVRTAAWAKADPAKAIAWFRDEVKSGRLDSSRLALSIPGGIYTGLRQAHPEEADAFYQTLTEDQRISVINHWSRSGTPEEFLDLAKEFKDPAKRQASLMEMFRFATKGKSPGEVSEWLDRTGTSGKDAVELLAIAAEGDPYRPDGGVRYYAGMKAHQIAERIEWLHDPGIGEESPAAVGTFLASTMKSAPEQTKEALDAEWKKNPDEEMLAVYISRAGASVPGVLDALDRSRYLSDPEVREQALRDLMNGASAKEAIDMIRKRGITDEEIEELQLPAGLFR